MSKRTLRTLSNGKNQGPINKKGLAQTSKERDNLLIRQEKPRQKIDKKNRPRRSQKEEEHLFELGFEERGTTGTSDHVFKDPTEVEKKYPGMKPYKIETSLEDTQEMSDYYEEDDMESENGPYEKENDPDTSIVQNQAAGFSILQTLNFNKEISMIEQLRDALSTGNALTIGAVLRRGFRDKTLTEVQVEEVCQSASRPNISLYEYYNDYERSTEEDRACISMGQMTLLKIAMWEHKSIQKIKASVNSLASSFAEQTKVALLSKRTLVRTHILQATEKFPTVNLTTLYIHHNLVGDSAFSQMTFFLSRVFKSLLKPKFHIWTYSFRPRCMRAKDKHFLYFPESIVESLIEFAIDVVGIYLPEDLLHGPIDCDHEFLYELTGSDDEKLVEIERRRNQRENVAQTMRKSIGQMMNQLRDYHYDVEKDELESCKKRNTCTNHLTWKYFKEYRETCRLNGDDPESYDVHNLISESKNRHLQRLQRDNNKE
ncbi:hypothetical protein B9Z55_007249 [Caenorhabditis nigoni]|nr:hypothetical protein B9Z55_007249 [Caenorhabditis nigoni]